MGADYRGTHVDAGCPSQGLLKPKGQQLLSRVLGWVFERSLLGLEESEVTPSSPPLPRLAETAVDGGTGAQILPINTSRCKMSIFKSVYKPCVPCA